MYSKINLADAPDHTRNDQEPTVRMLGYELKTVNEPRPNELRFNYFYYDEGQTVRRHKQKEQEELFYVVKGRGMMEVAGEEFEINEDDFVVVDAGPWRQIHALEDMEILGVGAPYLPDDAIFEADLKDNES